MTIAIIRWWYISHIWYIYDIYLQEDILWSDKHVACDTAVTWQYDNTIKSICFGKSSNFIRFLEEEGKQRWFSLPSKSFVVWRHTRASPCIKRTRGAYTIHITTWNNKCKYTMQRRTTNKQYTLQCGTTNTNTQYNEEQQVHNTHYYVEQQIQIHNATKNNKYTIHITMWNNKYKYTMQWRTTNTGHI